MNIKFLTIILSLALLAQNAKADEQEELAVFGLDEPAVETMEDIEIETVDETPAAEKMQARLLQLRRTASSNRICPRKFWEPGREICQRECQRQFL